MNSTDRKFGSTQLALLIFSFLAINPVVVFLLVNRPVLSLAFTLGAAGALQACYTRFRRGLPTVYLVNLLAIAGIFTHAELLVRYRFADYVMEDLYRIRDGYYVNRPELRSHLDDKEFSVDYLTNAKGFRIGYSQQVEISYDKIDWLFLGDSYTQGAQVEFEDLYTTQLYRQFPDRIVANAGISGWGIPEELNYFESEGREHDPEIVFVQVSNFNDFMKVVPRSADWSDRLMQHSHFVRFLLQDFKFENPARLPLGRWAEPFYPDAESNRRYNVFYTPSDPAKQRDLEAYRIYLGRLAASVRGSGARLVLILIPTKEQIRSSYLQEVVTGFGINPRDLDMQRPNKLMRQLADSLGVELIDVFEEFRTSPEEPFFEYDEHLNPYGHRLLADIIARRLSGADPARHPQLLSVDYAGDRYPSYSPDGAYMMFQSFADGNMELFWTDSAFSERHRVTVNDVQDSHPAIGFPGDRLAFTEGDQARGDTKVVISDLTTRNRRLITAGEDDFGAIPSFSPDGQHLAYAAWTVDRKGEFTTPRIVIDDLATGAKRELTDGRAEAWRPVFSPDGARVAYIAKVGSQFEVFVRELATGTVRRLTNTPYDEWDPRFSPDGNRLVFAAKANGNWDLFIQVLATGARSQLTQTRGDEWDPAFSPEGKQIIYGGEYGIFRGIYRMSLAQ
jgi:Tol biopolymer transport system component